LTTLLIGKTPAEIAAIGPADVDSAVGGLSAESKHAALLAVDAVRAIARKHAAAA
jgi:hypothetical protein